MHIYIIIASLRVQKVFWNKKRCVFFWLCVAWVYRSRRAEDITLKETRLALRRAARVTRAKFQPRLPVCKSSRWMNAREVGEEMLNRVVNSLAFRSCPPPPAYPARRRPFHSFPHILYIFALVAGEGVRGTLGGYWDRRRDCWERGWACWGCSLSDDQFISAHWVIGSSSAPSIYPAECLMLPQWHIITSERRKKKQSYMPFTIVK